MDKYYLDIIHSNQLPYDLLFLLTYIYSFSQISPKLIFVTNKCLLLKCIYQYAILYLKSLIVFLILFVFIIDL